MKILSTLLMFILFGVYANAQDAKVLAEIAASSEGTVKNSPFSAEAVSESVQTLADGNRIVRSSTSKLYRNSEGRFRREMTPGTGGMLGSVYTFGPGVTLLDPVAGFRYSIDPEHRTTRQMVIRPQGDIKVITGVAAPVAEGGVISEKYRAELRAAADEARASVAATAVVAEKVREEIRASGVAPALTARGVTGHMISGDAPGFAMTYATGSNSKWEKRTEELGTQNIEGVDAEGTRTITTIPAGAIGNERPIEITYEKWYSKDLQMVVMSKHNDPRFGEQTYRLTNIVRSEPDASLFTLPNGYKMITEPSGAYTISTPGARPTYVERPTPAQRPKAATVAKTKP